MARERYRDEYERLFITFCKRVELWLVRGIAISLVLLLAAQALVQIPTIRGWLTRVDSLEGVPYRYDSEATGAARTTAWSKHR